RTRTSPRPRRAPSWSTSTRPPRPRPPRTPDPRLPPPPHPPSRGPIMKRYQPLLLALAVVLALGTTFVACRSTGSTGDAAASYVAPGEYDAFYAFMSGGFNGQLSVYGLPSGRLF